MAKQENIGKICPFCQTEIKSEDGILICSDCEIPHHTECWNQNGTCTTYGCKGRPITESGRSYVVANQDAAVTHPAEPFDPLGMDRHMNRQSQVPATHRSPDENPSGTPLRGRLINWKQSVWTHDDSPDLYPGEGDPLSIISAIIFAVVGYLLVYGVTRSHDAATFGGYVGLVLGSFIGSRVP
jgi:hypothetical protein